MGLSYQPLPLREGSSSPRSTYRNRNIFQDRTSATLTGKDFSKNWRFRSVQLLIQVFSSLELSRPKPFWDQNGRKPEIK